MNLFENLQIMNEEHINNNEFNFENIINDLQSAYDTAFSYKGLILGGFNSTSGEPFVCKIKDTIIDSQGLHINVGLWNIESNNYKYRYVELSMLSSYLKDAVTTSKTEFINKLREYYKEFYEKHTDINNYGDYFISKSTSMPHFIDDNVELYIDAFN